MNEEPRATEVYDLEVVEPTGWRRTLRWLAVVGTHAAGGGLRQPGGHRIVIRDRLTGETMAVHVEGMDDVAAEDTVRLFVDHEHRSAPDFASRWIGATVRR